METLFAALGITPLPGTRAITLTALLLALLLPGCAVLAPSLAPSRVTTNFVETVGADGSMSTTFNAESRGNVDADVHSYHGVYGPETTTVDVGQEAQGVDSTAQIAATAAAIGQLLTTLQSIVPLLTPPPAPIAAGVSVAPLLLDPLTRIPR